MSFQATPVLTKPQNLRTFNPTDAAELGNESDGTGFSDADDDDMPPLEGVDEVATDGSSSPPNQTHVNHLNSVY
jgi:hypothetical protein